MKSVLFSIQPQWCNLIDSREKTIEVRKNIPKLKPPFKCYIYCTKTGGEFYPYIHEEITDTAHGYLANGTVWAEFICDEIYEYPQYYLSNSDFLNPIEKQDLNSLIKESCVSFEQLCAYNANKEYFQPFYGIHISNLIVYDFPKSLNDLFPNANKTVRPPQSWCYIQQ